MNAVASLLFGLAVILVALTGLTAMLGADKLRDRLAGIAAGATAAAIFLPYVGRVVAHATADVFYGINSNIYGINDNSTASTFMLAAFIAGHLGLAGAWVYAQVGPPAFVENVERARGRGRERVMPALEAEAGRE